MSSLENKQFYITSQYSYNIHQIKSNANTVNINTCHCLSQSKIDGMLPNQAPSNTKETPKTYCFSLFDSFL